MSGKKCCYTARESILKSSEAIRGFVTGLRRDIHKHAEVAWTEFRTGSRVARDLLNLGWEVNYGPSLYEKSLMMGMPGSGELERHAMRAIAQGGDKEIIDVMRGGYTGVVARLKTGDGNGPTVAFRFDIDANDLQEAHDEKHRPFREGFASVNDNADHACGHDCHTSIGVASAHVLYENRHLLPPGTIRLIFQTGEEGGRGGQPMAATGLADEADYFMAIHMALGDVGGLGGIAAGASKMSNSVKSDVTFRGVSAHAGSRPEAGKNALLAAANAAINLYAITRHSEGNTRVNVGVLQAGVGRNVIPPDAFMKIEVRGETRGLMDFMQKRAEDIIEGAAKMYDVEYSMVKTGETVSAPMDPEMVELVAETARQIPEVKNVIMNRSMTGGGEDCTFFMLRVQERGGKATMANIGTNGPAVGHNSYYDVDEEALVTGTKLVSLVALNALGRGRVRDRSTGSSRAGEFLWPR